MQIRKRLALMAAVLGVIVGTASGLAPAWGDLSTPWRLLGICAGLLSISGAVALNRFGGAVSIMVKHSDWIESNSEANHDYFIEIPRHRHGRMSPHVQLYEPRPDGSCEAVLSDVVIDSTGAVLVTVPERQELRVVIT